jgi:hypothetical protein
VQITPIVHISAPLDDKPSVTEEVDLTKQIDEAVNQTKLTDDYKQRLITTIFNTKTASVSRT